MKTEPMEHQKTGLELLQANPMFFALACEQGTGKTWMWLADVELKAARGDLTGLLVVAPKGVHSNWVLRELPKHVEVDWLGGYYVSGAGKRRQKRWEKLLDPRGPMKVLAMNVDAINTPKGFDFAKRFLSAHKAEMIIDESTRIKNPQAARTKKAINLGRIGDMRHIGSGTMLTRAPSDLFSQYEFLKPKGALLGTTSYRAFVAEHCELLPPHHPIVVEAQRKSKSRMPPQIEARDATGRPIYKGLESLREKIRPYTYRVLKKDCLDLPEKIYQTRFFELPAAQQRIYDQAETDLRYQRENGEVTRFNSLGKLMKLRQITSGFIMFDGQAERLQVDKNPRLELLMDTIQDLDGKAIIWASFQQEVTAIVESLRNAGYEAVRYDGLTGDADREDAVDSFQEGAAQFFVGNPAVGATGLTLTAAQTVIYYSNSDDLEYRLQSEDRAHRIGTLGDVTYIDLCAVGTVDERISANLQNKQEVGEIVFDL